MPALRLTQSSELPLAMDIINQAKSFLRAQGIDQWQDGYPDESILRADIEAGRGYFLIVGEEITGYLCVDFGGEPAYEAIDGAWLTGGTYGVVHRLAILPAFRSRGLASAAFELAAQLCLKRGVFSLRADTDPCNQIMQRAMKRSGFVYCGTILFAGSPKIAFERSL